jgi:hypothetical protein
MEKWELNFFNVKTNVNVFSLSVPQIEVQIPKQHHNQLWKFQHVSRLIPTPIRLAATFERNLINFATLSAFKS